MPFTGPREEHLAIRELYETYADGASRMDRDAWLGCYHSDAQWITHYFDLTGVLAIGEQYDAIMGSVVDTTFSLQFGAIEVDGDRARCTIYQSESLLYGNGSSYELVGRYADELVKREGRWGFHVRRYYVKREKPPVT